MAQYFGGRKIVSIVDNTVTFKGGEQKELTLNEKELLITPELLSDVEFKDRQHLAVMTLMSACYDTLNLPESVFIEGVNKFWASLSKKRIVAITNAMWITGVTPEEAMASITYKDILRNLPK